MIDNKVSVSAFSIKTRLLSSDLETEGAGSCEVSSTDFQTLSCSLPAQSHTGVYTVQMSYDGGETFQSTKRSFQVIERPVITDIFPKVLSSNQEHTLTVQGKNFNSNMKSVRFGSVNTHFVYVSPTEIKVASPIITQGSDFAVDLKIETVLDDVVSNSV
jgi:hypothetical protein